MTSLRDRAAAYLARRKTGATMAEIAIALKLGSRQRRTLRADLASQPFQTAGRRWCRVLGRVAHVYTV